MTEVKEYPPGTFCWVDLATTDAEVATKFYTQLLGLEATAVPAGEAGTYTMLEKNGKNVCGLYAMSDEMRKQGVPPHWQSYVSVKSADESAKKAEGLGGRVIEAPLDVMDVGRLAVVQDPIGAMFALWQPKQHMGADLVNEPGTLCWNELYTNDLEAASKFYTGLFDWTAEKSTGAVGEEYVVFHNGDRPAGGMLKIEREWGDVPPNWSVYFAVEDCDATLEEAQSLGAKVEVPPMEIEGAGRFAFLQDSQGAYFAVIQLKESTG